MCGRCRWLSRSVARTGGARRRRSPPIRQRRPQLPADARARDVGAQTHNGWLRDRENVADEDLHSQLTVSPARRPILNHFAGLLWSTEAFNKASAEGIHDAQTDNSIGTRGDGHCGCRSGLGRRRDRQLPPDRARTSLCRRLRAVARAATLAVTARHGRSDHAGHSETTSRPSASRADFANPLTSRMVASNTSGITCASSRSPPWHVPATIRPTAGTPARDQPAVVLQPLVAQRVQFVDRNDMRRKDPPALRRWPPPPSRSRRRAWLLVGS